MYKGLRPLFYGNQEREDCNRIKGMVKSGELFKLFKEQGIPSTEDSRLNLICEILTARASMILKEI